MVIIFKHISAKTRKLDIKLFITPTVNGGWFEKKGNVLTINILALRNLRTRDISHHALIEIEPDSVAERVIKKLHRKILLSKYVAVAEYKIRDSKNDPRRNKRVVASLLERRVCDRREQYEVLREEDFTLMGRRDFHRMG